LAQQPEEHWFSTYNLEKARKIPPQWRYSVRYFIAFGFFVLGLFVVMGGEYNYHHWILNFISLILIWFSFWSAHKYDENAKHLDEQIQRLQQAIESKDAEGFESANRSVEYCLNRNFIDLIRL
jgi:hypothetical protein